VTKTQFISKKQITFKKKLNFDGDPVNPTPGKMKNFFVNHQVLNVAGSMLIVFISFLQ